jgi:hypothetical protein
VPNRCAVRVPLPLRADEIRDFLLQQLALQPRARRSR